MELTYENGAAIPDRMMTNSASVVVSAWYDQYGYSSVVFYVSAQPFGRRRRDPGNFPEGLAEAGLL